MRDMIDPSQSLPDESEEFPDPRRFLGHCCVGHSRRQSRDVATRAREHPGQVVLFFATAQAGCKPPLRSGDSNTLHGVATVYFSMTSEVLTNLGVLNAPARDVTLLLEDLRDVRDLIFEWASHGVAGLSADVRRAQTRQHVRD